MFDLVLLCQQREGARLSFITSVECYAIVRGGCVMMSHSHRLGGMVEWSKRWLSGQVSQELDLHEIAFQITSRVGLSQIYQIC